MPRLEVRNTDRTKPESTYLVSSARKVYSQLGEEGIIEKIFGSPALPMGRARSRKLARRRGNRACGAVGGLVKERRKAAPSFPALASA